MRTVARGLQGVEADVLGLRSETRGPVLVLHSLVLSITFKQTVIMALITDINA